jgi:hypothetical protein
MIRAHDATTRISTSTFTSSNIYIYIVATIDIMAKLTSVTLLLLQGVLCNAFVLPSYRWSVSGRSFTRRTTNTITGTTRTDWQAATTAPTNAELVGVSAREPCNTARKFAFWKKWKKAASIKTTCIHKPKKRNRLCSIVSATAAAAFLVLRPSQAMALGGGFGAGASKVPRIPLQRYVQ